MNWLDDLAEATGTKEATKTQEPKAKTTDIVVHAEDVTPRGEVDMSYYHEDEGVRKLPPQDTTAQATEFKARCTVAGKFTVESKKTGRKITYKLNTKQSTNAKYGSTTFVSLCEGGKPEYLGILQYSNNKFSLRLTNASSRQEDHISVIAYKWLLDTFNQEPECMAKRLQQCTLT